MAGETQPRLKVGRRCDTELTTPDIIVLAKKSSIQRKNKHQTPSFFFDNLSKLWLVPRVLREFDRRTVPNPSPAVPRGGLQIENSAIIERFARHGGPDLSDLRSYSTPKRFESASRMSSRESGLQHSGPSNKKSDIVRTISTYDAAFEQHILDFGIHIVNGGKKPDNWEQIRERLYESRPSSPSRFSEQDFKFFQRQCMNVTNENSAVRGPLATIIGSHNIPFQGEVEFENLQPLTDGSLQTPRPDFFEGAQPSTLNRHMRKQLGPLIIPSSNTSYQCLPNFFLEVKGPTGNPTIATRQACYDSALGARGIHAVRAFTDPCLALDNKAYTITATYTGGLGISFLSFYVTHVTKSAIEGRAFDYHMTLTESFALTGNIEGFRKGVTAFRNAREWAEEQRVQLIADANAKAKSSIHPVPEMPETFQSSAFADIGSDISTENPIPKSVVTSSSSNSLGKRRVPSTWNSIDHRSRKRATRSLPG